MPHYGVLHLALVIFCDCAFTLECKILIMLHHLFVVQLKNDYLLEDEEDNDEESAGWQLGELTRPRTGSKKKNNADLIWEHGRTQHPLGTCLVLYKCAPCTVHVQTHMLCAFPKFVTEKTCTYVQDKLNLFAWNGS